MYCHKKLMMVQINLYDSKMIKQFRIISSGELLTDTKWYGRDPRPVGIATSRNVCKFIPTKPHPVRAFKRLNESVRLCLSPRYQR